MRAGRLGACARETRSDLTSLAFVTPPLTTLDSAKLDRFTIDRLMMIVDRLGRRVEVRITVRAGPRGGKEAPEHP